MDREIKDIKIIDSAGKTIELGKAIPVEPIFCSFCGHHICPGTQKKYYSMPLSSNHPTISTELCSVRCIREYYSTDNRKASTISVVEQNNDTKNP